jgi:hypothetical protein
MVFGQTREKPVKKGTDEFRHPFHRPTPFAYFHNSQPERHDTDQVNGYFDTGFGRLKETLYDGLENVPVSLVKNQVHGLQEKVTEKVAGKAEQRYDKAYNKKSYPDIV